MNISYFRLYFYFAFWCLLGLNPDVFAVPSALARTTSKHAIPTIIAKLPTSALEYVKKSNKNQPYYETQKDDNEDFFQALQNNADDVVRSDRFGKMYRDPTTKRWWAEDKDGHGGSCYKVFQKTAKGFVWLYDADSLGHKIVNKHKGPTGRLIPLKQVIGVKGLCCGV